MSYMGAAQLCMSTSTTLLHSAMPSWLMAAASLQGMALTDSSKWITCDSICIYGIYNVTPYVFIDIHT